jgi:polar amino acid transport system permease protein
MSLLDIYREHLLPWLSFLLPALLTTLEVSILVIIIGLVLGLPVAVMKMAGNRPARYLANAYIETLRGTPALVQLYFVYFGLTGVGIVLNGFTATIVALGLNASAYMAEIYRGGLQAIDSGQRHAAFALGLTPTQTLRHILLPQAWRVVLPPAGNEAIAIFKDSSLASTIAVPELMNRAYTLVGIWYQPFAIYMLVGLIYAVVAIPAAAMLRRRDTSRRWVETV